MKKIMFFMILIFLTACTPEGAKNELVFDFVVPKSQIDKNIGLDALKEIPGVLKYRVEYSDSTQDNYKIIELFVFTNDSPLEKSTLSITFLIYDIWEEAEFRGPPKYRTI